MPNQEQIPPQQEQPFVAAKQVSFNLEDIILNTNNEVALLYPEHNNQDYFKSTALENSKISFSIPTGGIFVEVGVNTFRNAIGAHYLAHSSEYVALPSIEIFRQWFPMIGYGEEVSAKGTLRKNLLPPRWRFVMAYVGKYIVKDLILYSKKRISTGKDGVIRILPPVTAAEIQVVEKERKAKNILLMAIPKEH
ncbi:hypothetical protein Tco_1083537, partial [Tanacetum coccineum]